MRNNNDKFIVLFVVVCMALCSCGNNADPLSYKPSFAFGMEDVNTNLPKVEITTPDQQEVTSKSEWMAGAQMTIYNTDGSIDYQGALSIKGRGNSTWGFPKKPYALKLDKKNKILGMPKHKRWCLLANWIDRTMMRNEIAFEIARQMPSLEYTPHGQFVELFLNGKHLGNYYLCEQIKVDENRVNIAELDEDATSGLGVTGGFIMEIDAHFDEDFRFMSDRAQMPWQCKDPDEVNDAQFEYIRNYVNEMEDALYDETRFANRDFTRYMDLNTFADWWLVHELTMNAEPQYPYSCIMHKDQDTAEGIAKMKAGPVWDFDYNTFIPAYSQQFTIFTNVYYPRLFKDNAFRQLVKERWRAVRDKGLQTHICDYIDQIERQLELSDQLNAPMWPVTNNINGDTYLGFHDAVQQLKKAFSQKYAWLDNAIENL